MKLIAAVDECWGIGRQGELLVTIPADQKNFRDLTKGGTVIYGRKTLSTFPAQKPLIGRRNVVLSQMTDFVVPGADVVHSVEEALALCRDEENCWVIGGESIYRAFLPYCTEAVITKIEKVYDADAYCPNLDEDDEWICMDESEEQTCFDIVYRFVTYRRKNA